jgi:hypothetical protein
MKWLIVHSVVLAFVVWLVGAVLNCMLRYGALLQQELILEANLE